MSPGGSPPPGVVMRPPGSQESPAAPENHEHQVDRRYRAEPQHRRLRGPPAGQHATEALRGDRPEDAPGEESPRKVRRPRPTAGGGWPEVPDREDDPDREHGKAEEQ